MVASPKGCALALRLSDAGPMRLVADVLIPTVSLVYDLTLENGGGEMSNLYTSTEWATGKQQPPLSSHKSFQCKPKWLSFHFASYQVRSVSITVDFSRLTHG